MAGPSPRTAARLLAALMAAGIVYGSLYPFIFRVPPHGIGPVTTLLASIGERPRLGDTIVNILFYMPFGFCFALGLGMRRAPILGVTTVIGGVLSLSMELSQYYVRWRYDSFNDVVTNGLGSFLGAFAAIAAGPRFRLPFVAEVVGRPIPTLLLLSWLAYRLFPYVPTNNPHKYWNALRPVFLAPSLTLPDLLREAAVWLAVYALVEAIMRRRQAVFVAPLLALAVLGAEVVISGIVVRLAEPAGAGLAFVAWLVLLAVHWRARAGVAGLALGALVVATWLEPSVSLPVGHGFVWVPFLEWGWLLAAVLACLDKFFLYGSMIYLLGHAALLAVERDGRPPSQRGATEPRSRAWQPEQAGVLRAEIDQRR
jgi:VanZ family protein